MAPRDTLPQLDLDTQDGIEPDVAGPVVKHNPLIGFAAGICSGLTKLVVGHPFDTIKVGRSSTL